MIFDFRLPMVRRCSPQVFDWQRNQQTRSFSQVFIRQEEYHESKKYTLLARNLLDHHNVSPRPRTGSAKRFTPADGWLSPYCSRIASIFHSCRRKNFSTIWIRGVWHTSGRIADD